MAEIAGVIASNCDKNVPFPVVLEGEERGMTVGFDPCCSESEGLDANFKHPELGYPCVDLKIDATPNPINPEDKKEGINIICLERHCSFCKPA